MKNVKLPPLNDGEVMAVASAMEGPKKEVKPPYVAVLILTHVAVLFLGIALGVLMSGG
jgi:hypothetical protein